MKVLLAGASGVIGVRLIPLLLDAGHRVIGMTRSPQKADSLRRLGAEPVVRDVFDPEALLKALAAAEPDLVSHQLTDLPDERERIPEYAARSQRMYREGTQNLVRAAQEAAAGQVTAQSVAWEPPGETRDAVKAHESTVLDAGGALVRYGRFYGPGTYFELDPPPSPRIHVDEAARRTVEVLRKARGVRFLPSECQR